MGNHNEIKHLDNSLKVNDFKECLPILNSINWSFNRDIFYQANEIIPFDSRRYLSYPATFIPQIPYTLIDVLTKPGAIIYDPFGGSGTTFFQSILLKRIPITTDICRVSYEYISGLFYLFNPSLDKKKLLGDLVKILEKYDTNSDYERDIKLSDLQKKLKLWFSRRTFNCIAFLINEINEINDQNLKCLLNIALLSVLKNSSSQDRSWGCIADNMIPKSDQIRDKEVFSKIYSISKRILFDIEARISKEECFMEFYRKLSSSQRVFPIDARLFDNIDPESVDCIITSPPYLNMTDYITSQRLAYYYLNIDPDKEKFHEIGARFKRARKNSAENYIEEMKLANSKFCNFIKNGGYLCLVLPEFNVDLKRDQLRQDVLNTILEDIELEFMVKRVTYERNIPTMRRSHNSFWASLEKEKIYIFQKNKT